MWAGALYSVYSSEQLHKYWPIKSTKNGVKAVFEWVCIEFVSRVFRVNARSSLHQ